MKSDVSVARTGAQGHPIVTGQETSVTVQYAVRAAFTTPQIVSPVFLPETTPESEALP